MKNTRQAPRKLWPMKVSGTNQYLTCPTLPRGSASKNDKLEGFPGSSVVRTLSSQLPRAWVQPWLGTKIPRAAWPKLTQTPTHTHRNWKKMGERDVLSAGLTSTPLMMGQKSALQRDTSLQPLHMASALQPSDASFLFPRHFLLIEIA